MWALGDYHRFALGTVWGSGRCSWRRCGIAAGQRVLDVAAGLGQRRRSVPPEAGADVVASDLTPEISRPAAERRALAARARSGYEADAQALPFEDGEFDVVTLLLGASSPRTIRRSPTSRARMPPGGTIGMINFTPDGLASDSSTSSARYAPAHSRRALPGPPCGEATSTCSSCSASPGRVPRADPPRVRRADPGGDPPAYCKFFKETFGPVVGTIRKPGGRPECRAALDGDFLEFARDYNHGPLRRAGGVPLRVPDRGRPDTRGAMKRAPVAPGLELEYEVRGSGGSRPADPRRHLRGLLRAAHGPARSDRPPHRGRSPPPG